MQALAQKLARKVTTLWPGCHAQSFFWKTARAAQPRRAFALQTELSAGISEPFLDPQIVGYQEDVGYALCLHFSDFLVHLFRHRTL